MLTYTQVVRTAVAAFALFASLPVRAADVSSDVEVTSAVVQFDLRAPHRARAALEVGLHVGSGGLMRFELFDLGPNAQLDPYAPPQFVGVDGTVYLPSVRALPSGGVALEFPDRRSALERGEYVLRGWWHVPRTAAGSATLRMPSWPNRVGNARLVVLAPRAAQPAAPARYDQWSRRDLGAASSELSFTRAELPRTESFAVTLTLPMPEQHARARKLVLPDARRVFGLALGLVLGLGWLSKRRACKLPPRDDPSAAIVLAGSLFAVGAFDVWPLMAAVAGVCASLIGSHSCRGAPLPAENPPSRHDAAEWFEITHPGGASAALLALALLAYAEPFAPAAVRCSVCLLASLFLTVRRAPHRLPFWRRAHAV
jgi:hypothetical protein